MFQIVRIEISNDGKVLGRHSLQPLYDLFEDAQALAEFDASRCSGHYGYDDEQECWWGRDADRTYLFIIEWDAVDEIAA
jgi:hypothetical protein